MVTSCGDDEEPVINNGNNNGGGDSNTDGGNGGTVLVQNMTEAQSVLDRTGRTLAQKVDANDLKPVAELADYALSLFDGDDEDDYYNPEYPVYPTNMARTVLGLAKDAATLNVASVAQKRAITELFRAADYYGEYVWNEKDHDWDGHKDEKYGSLTYIFNHEGSTCKLVIKAGADKYEIVEKGDSGNNTRIMVPENLTMTVTEGNITRMSANVNITECNYSGRNFATDMTYNVGNSLVIYAKVTDNNSLATAEGSVKSNGEELITYTANLTGSKLGDAMDMIDDEWDVKNNLDEGTVKLSILNQISIEATADNRDRELAKGLDYDGDWYYYRSWQNDSTTHENFNDSTIYKSFNDSTTHESFRDSEAQAQAEATHAADVANQYIKGYITYNGSEYKTPIIWQAYEADKYNYSYNDPYYHWSYENAWGTWGIEPLLQFENGTTYSFESWFTDTRFNGVIEAFEDLANRIGL